MGVSSVSTHPFPEKIRVFTLKLVFQSITTLLSIIQKPCQWIDFNKINICKLMKYLVVNLLVSLSCYRFCE